MQTDYLAVARRAAEYIEDKDVIYITTSLVGYYMAENLPEDVSITVLTNSVTVAEVLRKKMNVSVILLGGAMSHRGHCHDYYTIQMVNNIRINKAFLSHTALALDFGASIHDPAGVAFGRAVMKNSSMNIGLYPSKKIGKHSVHAVCPITDYDLLITDSGVSEDFLVQAGELGVTVGKGREQMYCILVTGPPAAGKSTMAELLSDRLKLPALSKDRVKELLFDYVGFQSREGKVNLGVASTDSDPCCINIHTRC